MKKKIAIVLAVIAALVIGGAAVAYADPYDDETGTVTIMVSGGTAYEDHTTGAQGLPATAASVTVPAGRYQVQAKARAHDLTSAAGNMVQCGLTALGKDENGRATLVADGYATVAALGVVEFETETAIEYFCSALGSAEVEYTVLVATTLSAIDEQ